MATAARPRGRLYEALDRFVVRAPLLPVDAVTTPDGAADPRVDLAIAVAAPRLASAVAATRGSSASRSGQRQARLRYRIRMATRPTPFGLFAGVGLGTWGAATDLRLDGASRSVAVRPDMGWLLGLVEVLEARPEIRRQLRVVVNPCALVRDGRVYLADPSTAGQTTARDVSVRASPPVRMVLELARRPLAYGALVDALRTRPGGTDERVHQLLDDLWRQGLLLTDLIPPLTADPVEHVASRLAALSDAAAGEAELMADVVTAVHDLEVVAAAATTPRPAAEAVARAGKALAAVRSRVRALHDPGQTAGQPADVVQVDSGLPLAGSQLSRRVASEAIRAVELLLRLHPSPGGPPTLSAYRGAFVGRYGHERLVPLPEVLDPRFGLGPPGSHVHADHDASGRAERDATLMELGCTALRDGTQEVELDAGLLDALALWRPTPDRVPASLELSAFVVAASAAAVDRGDFRLVVGPNLGAEAAGRGLGRFATLLGPPAADLLAEIAEREHRARPNAVHAELVYRPGNPRSANVTIRPAVRTHEIAVGVSPGVTADAVVPIDELAVGVAEGRLQLWWPARDCEVIVTSGHMLNSWAAPPVARLLADFALDGITTLSDFDWGPAAALPCLPRVRAGRVVLRAAEWRQRRSTMARALAVDDDSRFAGALQRWRERWQVPRHVYLAAGDNRLLLDLDEPEQAELLRTEVRRDRAWHLVLEEALPGPADAWVPGPDGGYASEIVVPLVRAATTPAARGSGRRPVALLSDSSRRRPPGSDWLYLTLYGPRPAENEFVAGPLRTFCAELVRRGAVDAWWFLRYADPDAHVRLRLQGTPATLHELVLPEAARWAAQLVAEGVRTRFGVDIYERELERYGGETGMAIAEALFAADSAAVAELLAAGSADGDLVEVAALTIDDLLDCLGFDSAARLAWYGAAAGPPRESAAAYRERQVRLRRLLGGDVAMLGSVAPRWRRRSRDDDPPCCRSSSGSSTSSGPVSSACRWHNWRAAMSTCTPTACSVPEESRNGW